MLAHPDQYRTVIMLRDVEELSTAETAAALDLTEENVKVRLHRGRAMMRESLFTRSVAAAKMRFHLWAALRSCGFGCVRAALGNGALASHRRRDGFDLCIFERVGSVPFGLVMLPQGIKTGSKRRLDVVDNHMKFPRGVSRLFFNGDDPP